MDLASLARPLIEIGRRLYDAGVLAGTDGSLSQRYPDGTRTGDGELVRSGAWLVTARGAHQGSLTGGQVAAALGAAGRDSM
jgi:hypothetical protein